MSSSYDRGYKAGLNGYGQDACQFEEESGPYWQWIDGWNKAVDYWEGRDEFVPATQWEEIIVRV